MATASMKAISRTQPWRIKQRLDDADWTQYGFDRDFHVLSTSRAGDQLIFRLLTVEGNKKGVFTYTIGEADEVTFEDFGSYECEKGALETLLKEHGFEDQ